MHAADAGLGAQATLVLHWALFQGAPFRLSQDILAGMSYPQLQVSSSQALRAALGAACAGTQAAW